MAANERADGVQPLQARRASSESVMDDSGATYGLSHFHLTEEARSLGSKRADGVTAV